MKILVISSNLIGDTILSTGVIENFYKRYPHAKFTFLIGPTASQIYQHFPGLDKIFKIRKKSFNLHWIEMYLKNRHVNWDVIIDLRSSLLPYFFKAKKRYIFKKNNNLHHIEQLNESFKLNANSLCVYTHKTEEEQANQKINNQNKHIVIFPGGNWIPKIWLANNYNTLLKELIKRFENIKFILVGSNIEKSLYFKKIIEEIPNENIIDLMGKTLTLTSAFMKRSNLFIGNDSGLMHLSVASKLKTIALFGPTNDRIYGPKGENCFVVRTKETYDFLCRGSINVKKSYMNSICVEDILNLIENKKLLK